tara:strand:+ start:711 stop:857 length:147 start_codon:yes stop_codon:yes gene_type:complete
MEQKQYIITKKIAKQGDKSVICIPSLLKDELKPSTVVRLTIDVIKEAK